MKKAKRMIFNDISYGFRMPAGIPGAVTRSHPVDINAELIDSNAPPTAYGQGVLIDPTTQGVRPLAAGDGSGSLALYGLTVRPYPAQQATAAQNFAPASLGAGTPPTSGVIDVCRRGYVNIGLPAGSTAPVKGGTVYVWTAATSGVHIQGGFESAANGGNTATVSNAIFMGGQDASGNAEIAFNI